MRLSNRDRRAMRNIGGMCDDAIDDIDELEEMVKKLEATIDELEERIEYLKCEAETEKP